MQQKNRPVVLLSVCAGRGKKDEEQNAQTLSSRWRIGAEPLICLRQSLQMGNVPHGLLLSLSNEASSFAVEQRVQVFTQRLEVVHLHKPSPERFFFWSRVLLVSRERERRGDFLIGAI